MSEPKPKFNPDEYEAMVDRDRDDAYMKKVREKFGEE